MKYKSGHYWVSYNGDVQIARCFHHNGRELWYVCGRGSALSTVVLHVLSKEPIEPPNFD